MRKSEKLYIAVFLLLGAGFAWGLYLILQIPLLSGQAYSTYSTYRSDPLGLSVLHNALEAAPGLRVERNEHSLMQIGEGEEKTLVLAGATDSDDFRLLIEALERFVQTGGRLIIAFQPDYWLEDETSMGINSRDDEENEDKSREELRRERRREAREKAEKKKGESRKAELMVNISERWDFTLDSEKLPNATEDSPGSIEVQRTESAGEQLPESLLWRSASYFDKQAKHWEVLYARDGKPVVMERTWDQGSIILASDSYFLSNEAMHRHRYPALLAWLVGPHAEVIFDETHLGISRDPGIVGLMRRYRLTPLMIGFVVVTLLFIWKNSLSLVPKQALSETRGNITESGKSAAAGLNSLLRRSTPKGSLIAACMHAWRQDYARARQMGPAVEERMRQIGGQEAAQAHPEKVYNEIAAMLKERERK